MLLQNLHHLLVFDKNLQDKKQKRLDKIDAFDKG